MLAQVRFLIDSLATFASLAMALMSHFCPFRASTLQKRVLIAQQLLGGAVG